MDTRHLAWLNQMTDNQIIVLYGPVQQNVDDVCDLALETALSKMLLSSKLSARWSVAVFPSLDVNSIRQT